MATLLPWRNHSNTFVVDCYLPSTRFRYSESGELASCILPDGESLSVGDVINGKRIQRLEVNSVTLYAIFD